MKLVTLDVETTMKAPKDIGASHPMHPDNRIVLLGTKENKIFHIYDYPVEILSLVLDDVDYIVGCNMSFDLCYLYQQSYRLKVELQNHALWDVQLAEYLITAQQSKFPSLDEMCIKYGLPVKDDKVTKYFKEGLGAEFVPRDLLEEYLKTDLDNTEAIARMQMAMVKDLRMENLVRSQMGALHAVTEMMYNGLAVDMDYFKTYTVEVANTFVDVKYDLEKSLKDLDPMYYPISDVGSPIQYRKLLFGGTLKTPVKEAVGLFKNGKIKYKLVTHTRETVPLADIEPDESWKSKVSGHVSVDEKVLSVISNTTRSPTTKNIVDKLLLYRDITKQLSTYIQGLGKHLVSLPLQTYIYGCLNQTATTTGRLSSTKPNLQNISNNPIKKAFISRWGEQGVLVEFDFKQLEVAVLAHVTKCPRLIEDIAGGKDIHTELYFSMYGKKPDPDTRKWFKRLTFGLIYGAGVKTLAENAGCTTDVAKLFVGAFYTRYPEVKEWNGRMTALALSSASYDVVASIRDLSRTWRHTTETGRIYTFKEYPSLWDTDRKFSFSPTELKNYPIQGLATGDIVPMMLGVLFKELRDNPNVKLVNTVHDSIMLDVHKISSDYVVRIITKVKDILDNTHKYYLTEFETPLALKLTAGCEIGANWHDLKEI